MIKLQCVAQTRLLQGINSFTTGFSGNGAIIIFIHKFYLTRIELLSNVNIQKFTLYFVAVLFNLEAAYENNRPISEYFPSNILLYFVYVLEPHFSLHDRT